MNAVSPNKYEAVWVSHSSIGDFLKCPRCYFLHNIYKDARTRRKMNIVSPATSLGSAVHEVLENLATMPVEERQRYIKEGALLKKFESSWQKISGKKGGFTSDDEEAEAKSRGVAMIERVTTHPGPLLEKTVRLAGAAGAGDMLPHFFLSEKENIILCGKVDWLVYKPADDSVHILDFKTGKNGEKDDSLQMPIYLLLIDRLQKRKVSGASYWYVDRDDMPTEAPLPKIDDSFERVMGVALRIKEARAAKSFACPKGDAGCFACTPFEKIIRGEARYIGVGEYNQDLYMV